MYKEHFDLPWVVTHDLTLSILVTDAFVNSQEWTLSRSVPELKVVSGTSGLLERGAWNKQGVSSVQARPY